MPTPCGWKRSRRGTAAPFENLQKLAYAYDLAGNVQTLTDTANSGQVQSFGYDWLDRLTTAATDAVGIGQYSHTYAYNAIGNLTSYNGNTYTYGSQPHAVTAAFGNAYGYDAVGNQTSRTIAGTRLHAELRLRQPPARRRRRECQRDVPLRRGWQPGQGNRGGRDHRLSRRAVRVPEWRGHANTTKAARIRRTGYATDNGVFYTLSDQLRSTSVLVNQNGTVNSRNYYYPYGGNRGGARSAGSRPSGSRASITSRACRAARG